jgi:hypothetical protein
MTVVRMTHFVAEHTSVEMLSGEPVAITGDRNLVQSWPYKEHKDAKWQCHVASWRGSFSGVQFYGARRKMAYGQFLQCNNNAPNG